MMVNIIMGTTNRSAQVCVSWVGQTVRQSARLRSIQLVTLDSAPGSQRTSASVKTSHSPLACFASCQQA